MAYNTKYILNFCNRDLIPMRIEIQLQDYVGEAFILVNEDDYLIDDEGRFVVTNIDGAYDPDRDQNPIEATGTPFNLTYANDSGEKRGTIRATHADMQFFENNIFNIDDLATSDETELRVIFNYNNELEWIGYVTPDFFNVEITENPVISLTASDRIGILKDVSYTIEDFYTDERVSLLSIFVKAIKETGLDLPINVACRMYCANYPMPPNTPEFESYEQTNYLQDTYVSELRFVTDEENEETMSCYDVLKRIMDQCNCLLTQYKGEWWVLNKFDMELGESIRFRYDSEGAYQSIGRITFGEEHFSLIDTGGQRTLIPAGAKNTYLLDHGQELTYPKNSRFNISDPVVLVPESWQKTGNIYYVYTPEIPMEYNAQGVAVNVYDDTRSHLRLQDYIISDPNPGIGTVDVAWNQRNIQSSLFPVGATNKKYMNLDLSVEAVGKPSTGILVRFCLYFPSDDLLFVSSHIDNNQSYYCYTYSELATSTEPYPISFFEFENKYNDVNIPVENKFTINKSTSISYLKKIASDSGKTMLSEDFSNASMFVRLYPSFSRSTGIAVDMVIKSIEVEFMNDNQTPSGTIFESRIDGKFTKPVDRVDVLFGDYQEAGQNGFFYRYREDSLSIQYNIDGERLQDWFTPIDSELNPMLVHTLRQQTKMYGRAHDELAIGFDMNRINPFAHYAIRCKSERYILVNPEDDYLQDEEGTYITTTIGKYLNSKRFVFVEGTIDYLRSHFTGKLAQVRTNDVQHQEFIYSHFGDNEN